VTSVAVAVQAFQGAVDETSAPNATRVCTCWGRIGKTEAFKVGLQQKFTVFCDFHWRNNAVEVFFFSVFFWQTFLEMQPEISDKIYMLHLPKPAMSNPPACHAAQLKVFVTVYVQY